MLSLVKRSLLPFRAWKAGLGLIGTTGAQARQLMLDLVNRERNRAGSPPVILSDRLEVQFHADDCQAMGVGSHWNLEGLKPYMRYSIGGGSQNNGENWFQFTRNGNTNPGDIQGAVRLAMKIWMDSPGHRRTVLDPWYRKLNVGLCWSANRFTAIQHFEGDFMEYTHYPAIYNGIMQFSGIVKNGVTLSSSDDLVADLWFDPPRVAMDVGQLLRVNGYDTGIPIARLRRILPEGYYWQQDSFTIQFARMKSPEQIPPNASLPKTLRDRMLLLERAFAANQEAESLDAEVPLIDCEEWKVNEAGFSVRADVGSLIDHWGEGVYSLVLHSPMESTSQFVTFSHYSMFLE